MPVLFSQISFFGKLYQYTQLGMVSIEEGLALQSLFDPSYANVALWGARMFGVNWVYASVVILWIHPVWSVAIPILLTELLFPTQRTLPSLGWIGLIGTFVWYVLDVVLLGLFARTVSPYHVSLIQSDAVILIALMLVVGALFVLPRQVPRAKRPRDVPRPLLKKSCPNRLKREGHASMGGRSNGST